MEGSAGKQYNSRDIQFSRRFSRRTSNVVRRSPLLDPPAQLTVISPARYRTPTNLRCFELQPPRWLMPAINIGEGRFLMLPIRNMYWTEGIARIYLLRIDC